MQSVFEGDKRIKKILGIQKIPTGNTKVRLSGYTLFFSFQESMYAASTLTREIIRLSEEEYSEIISSREGDLPAEQLSEVLKDMYQKYFLVRSSTDETEKYLSTMMLLRKMAGPSKGLEQYTILPTTACNARCVYCFETGMKFRVMSMETAIKLADFIERTRNPKVKILVQWFGGEPLCAAGIIDYVSQELNRRGIEYKARIVTNASLLTDEIADKMAGPWHIYTAQITLDGDEEEYLKRKQYCTEDGSQYRQAIAAILRLAERKIKVHIRLNIDRNNVESVRRCVEDLNRLIPNTEIREYISIYKGMLFQEQAKDDSYETWVKAYDIEHLCRKLGFRTSSVYKYDKTEPTFCMASDPARSRVIDPLGRLCMCENAEERMFFGDIEHGVTNEEVWREWTKPSSLRDKCRNCACLPYCTEFDRCPTVRKNCSKVVELAVIEELKHQIAMMQEAEK